MHLEAGKIMKLSILNSWPKKISENIQTIQLDLSPAFSFLSNRKAAVMLRKSIELPVSKE
jgi:hypothetical protein